MHRVLFTASTYSHIVNFHRPYLQEFKRRGWGVDVGCGGRPMEIPEADRVIHIPFEKKMTSSQNVRATRLLRGLIRANRYALVSCHTALASFFTRAAILGLRRRPAVACTVHGYLFGEHSTPKEELLLGTAERLTAPVTDLLMTMNHWDTAYAKAHRYGRRIIEIPGMGVDPSHLPQVSLQEAAFFRTQLGFRQDQFLLLFGAEFSPRKNQAELLRALSFLPEQVGLLLPGDGALRDTCIQLARTLGVEQRVAFPGHVDDMPLWYAMADCVVSPSQSEGLPFHLMEAMYYGLPIIASDIKGHADLLGSSHAGLLFSPHGMAEGCAAQVQRLLAEPGLARRLGQAGQEAITPYTLPQVLPQIMELYHQVVPLDEPEKVYSLEQIS